MAEPLYLQETRASYDTVAADYAALVPPAFEGDTLGRAFIGAFAELVRDGGGGSVVDVGCGPGHVTAYLDSLGLNASGLDLSPAMIDVARRAHPGLRFDVGTMTELDQADGALGGVVAWYSIVHTPPEVLPEVFAEFHRVLSSGGHVLLGFHVGDEKRRKTTGYGGHPMALDVHRHPTERIAAAAAGAGLSVLATLIRQSDGAPAPGACLLLRARSGTGRPSVLPPGPGS